MRKLIVPAAMAILVLTLVASGVTRAARDTGGPAGGLSVQVDLNVQEDICGHDPFIWGSDPPPHNLKLTVIKDGAFIAIQGQHPWVNVTGQQDPQTGGFLATGTGQVGPNPGATVQMEGTLEGQTLTGKYVMGAGPADLPPCGPPGAQVHHPAVYEVKPKDETPTPTEEEKLFSIIVLKLNSVNNQPLAGFEFNLYAGSNCQGSPVLSRTTGGQGLVDFTGLDPGTYSIEEKEEPGWNVVGEDCQTVLVPQGGIAGVVPTCPIDPNEEFPQPGCDTFVSGARVIVEINATEEEFPVTLNGPTQIARLNKPHKVNGFDRVDTEIVFMELVGASPFGNITVHESDSVQSRGAITEQENNGANEMSFPADSFFDVFFDIEIEDLGLTLHNEDPFRVECKIEEIPPILCFYQPPIGEPIELVNDDGVKIAKITHALHIPLPPKETLVIFVNEPKGTATPTPTRTPTRTPTPQGQPTATPTPRPTNPPRNGLCTKTAQDFQFQGSVYDVWKCRPDVPPFQFNRVDIFVGVSNQEGKLDPEFPPLFVCQSNEQKEQGLFKGYKKNVNPGTNLPHHEVWSADFEQKCVEGVDVYVHPRTPSNHPTIQGVAFTNTSAPTPAGGGGGDVDKNGSINAIDAALVSQAVAGLTTLQHPDNADVNRDDRISALDTLLILQKVAGLIPSLPV